MFRIRSYQQRFRKTPSFNAFLQLSGKTDGFVLDVINDTVLVRDSSTPANNFVGTMAEALSNSILVYSSPSTKYVRNLVGEFEPGTTLRCHYDESGAALGLLSEPQRTNLWYRSSDLSVSPWTWDAGASPGGGESVSAGDASCYGGTLWTIQRGTVAQDRRQSKTVTANTQTAISLNTKRGNQALSAFEYVLLGGSGTQILYFSYNHDTDTVTASASGGALTLNSSGRDLLADGEVRLWAVVTPADGGTAGYVLLHRKASNFTSTETAQYGHVQVEYGAFRTSYIKTEASAVTRNADNLYVDLTKVPFSATAGSIITIGQPPQDSLTGGARFWQVDDGTNDNAIYTKAGTAGSKQRSASIVAATAEQLTVTPTTNDSAARFAEAVAWEVDNAQLVVNGATRGSADTSVTLPTGLTTLRIGGGASHSDGSYAAAPFEMLVYFPERLSQADMIARTTL